MTTVHYFQNSNWIKKGSQLVFLFNFISPGCLEHLFVCFDLFFCSCWDSHQKKIVLTLIKRESLPECSSELPSEKSKWSVNHTDGKWCASVSLKWRKTEQVVLVITLSMLGEEIKNWKSAFVLRVQCQIVLYFSVLGKKVKGQNATQLGSEPTENSCGSLYNSGCGKAWMLATPQTHSFKGKVRSTYCGSERNSPLSLSSSSPLQPLSDELQVCPRREKTIYANDFLLHWLALGSGHLFSAVKLCL